MTSALIGHRARLLVGLALVFALSSMGSTAQAAAPAWVLRGDRTGSGWIVLEQSQAFIPDQITVRGGGEYVGVLIEPDDVRSIPAVFVKFRDGTTLGTPIELRPGRYRITLLAGARAAVDIPKAYGGDDEIIALKPARSAAVRHAAAVIPPGINSVESRIQQGVPAAHRAYLLALRSGQTPAAGEFDICAAASNARCPSSPNLLPVWNALSIRVTPSAAPRDAMVVGQNIGGQGSLELLAVSVRE